MSRLSCGLLVGVVATSLAAPLLAAGLDEDKIRTALLERFDENRNDKLEPLEAKQARTRMRNLLEDKSEREINIHTWRDDVKPLLMTLDPDEDRRLTDKERTAATALLERLIPKVAQDESRGKEQSSVGSSSGDRKRDSASRRSNGHDYSVRPGGYAGYVGPWTMNGGGWGMNRNYGPANGTPIGGHSFNGGSSSFIASNERSRFFSGSGLENANPSKGDLGTAADSLSATNAQKAVGIDQTRRAKPVSEPLADSPMGTTPDLASSDQPGKKPDGHPGKDKPIAPADPLGGGVDTSSGDDSPKRGAPVGPKLVPPVPKPAF